MLHVIIIMMHSFCSPHDKNLHSHLAFIDFSSLHLLMHAFNYHHADKELDSVWQKLTPLEQKEFEETVKSGRIGHLIIMHTPWWEVSLVIVAVTLFLFEDLLQ